ncbi:DNA starvation/stationary phase protection protein [Ferruginibacter paludis]|uniref:Dps family protein n=1 Tax=Ferruginibacter paludis TaxID=1310417 RepID=UPI0025B590DF|nr:DNA starvation/stationary phase protection protein [Ferruginibacter paludis]MDN3654212.1 DNA starvation/stationary phase protection protein [Ferruginibacter paludis]
MKPNLGIPENHLQVISSELNKLLSDEFILYTKSRNYHWNIEGSNFSEMHQFYERQVNEINDMIDDIAERIRTIGFYAEGRLEDYLKLTSLIEQPFTNSQNDQLKNLLGSHETIINNLRRLITLFADKHKDVGSSDFAVQLLEKHEKMAWMIRAHLSGH